MRRATVREVQHGLGGLLDRVERGEEITVTRRGRVVARLVPAREQTRKVEWPDFAARMKRLFPAGSPRGKPPSELIAEDREERS